MARRDPDLPPAARLRPRDLIEVLAEGWQDFRTAPAFGLLLTSPYALAGLAMLIAAPALAAALAVAFALVAPVVAVALYQVSRCIRQGTPLDWPATLRVLPQGGRALRSAAGMMLLAALLWLASWQAMGPGAGRLILGAVLAVLVYVAVVAGWPLLLDRRLGIGQAVAASWRAVAVNPIVLGLWACVLAGALLLAMAPAFLGLPVVLPVLGHASWHLYQRLYPGIVSPA